VRSKTTSKVFILGIFSTLTILPAASARIVGTVYLISLAATGGTPPYTWLIPSGVLPVALLLNPNTACCRDGYHGGNYSIGVQVFGRHPADLLETVTLDHPGALQHHNKRASLPEWLV